MTDDLDVRRRRAAYRASHRGTKEMDWLLGRFAAARLPALAGEPLAMLERLITMPDPDLHEWIVDPATLGTSDFAALIGDIRAFHGLDTGQVPGMARHGQA